MSTYEDPSIAELEAQMNKVHAEVDTRLSNCDKIITKLETRHHEADEHFKKAETLLAEHKVTTMAPHVALAAQKLPSTELKLKVAEYELKRKTEECKRLEAKHLDARKSALRVKKEKKQLTKTVETLTAQLEGKATPEDKDVKTENEKLKEELAVLRAQLKGKNEECEMKDQFIADLTEDFAAYQHVTSEALSKRHEGCDELHAALDEQCDMLTAERDTLTGNLNTLYHKCDSLAIERDHLQGRFDDAIKAHQMELEDYDALKCEGSSSCTSCVVHLGRALRISRAAEAQALQLVDQVNHDRMVAWNQLHEHQTRVVQEHYAAVGSWVAARQAPSVSLTLVSPTFVPGECGSEGWKISEIYSSSEDGSVEFVL